MAIQIRYLGWTAFELTVDGGPRILLDPMLSGRPADGIAPSPVAMESLFGVDYVLITHAAGDHVGQAFDILKQSQAILVCDAATRHLADAAGIPKDRVYHMVSGVAYTFPGFSVKALWAKHLSVAQTGTGFVSGEPLSYLIRASSGERVFFAGDTSIHSDLKLYGELYHPHVAMLGVGGVDVQGQSLTELHPDEAVLAAKWLGVQMAIPMHYRFREGEQFIAELEALAPTIRGELLSPGEQIAFACES